MVWFPREEEGPGRGARAWTSVRDPSPHLGLSSLGLSSSSSGGVAAAPLHGCRGAGGMCAGPAGAGWGEFLLMALMGTVELAPVSTPHPQASPKAHEAPTYDSSEAPLGQATAFPGGAQLWGVRCAALADSERNPRDHPQNTRSAP